MPKIHMSKRGFLEELAKGKSIKSICLDYGYKSTTTVYKWRKTDPQFDDAVAKMLESPAHKDRLRTAKVTQSAPDSWMDVYFMEVRESKDRVKAADRAGKTVTFILNASNPEHKDFDQAFADRLFEESSRDALQIEDEVKKKALIENSVQMQKFLLPYLPVVGDKYKRGRENRLQEKTQNVFVFSKEGMEGASRVLQGLFGKEVKELN